MSQTDTIYLSVADASAQIESGALSPLDLTRAILDRIEATDGAINSVSLRRSFVPS